MAKLVDARDLKSLDFGHAGSSPALGTTSIMNLEKAIHAEESKPAAYVLASADGTYRYKGSCRNLAKRLKDHRAGGVSRTKNRRPLMLLHCEYFPDYSAARKQELYFKSGAGREWLTRRYP